MHPFAPKKPTSDSGHPGDEELAAYVDGMLGEEDAARVAGHLAACADCYRVYSETLRFQLEEGEEEEPAGAPAEAKGEVVPFPSDRKAKAPWWLAAAAAVLVVGLGVGLFMTPLWEELPDLFLAALFEVTPEMTTAELVEPLQGETDLGSVLWRGPTYRGEGDDLEDSVSNVRSFQIGVQLVNLQVALQQNNAAAADDALARLIGLLEEELLIDPQYKEYYSNLRVAISEGKAPQHVLEESSAKSQELLDFLDDPHAELGRFAEAGRLAAIAEEPSFFERWRARRLLRKLLQQQEKGGLEIGPEALKSLRAVSQRLKEGDLQPSDYSMLREQFEVILKIYYRT